MPELESVDENEMEVWSGAWSEAGSEGGIMEPGSPSSSGSDGEVPVWRWE